MIFSIAWRNVWRNKVRSLVIMSAIALGLTAGIFATAFMVGMMHQRIDKAIKTEIAHIQIHNNDFRQSNDIKSFIPDATDVQNEIAEMEHVMGVATRTVIFSMISSAETASGVKITGIDTTNEKLVSNLHTKIVEGSYFNEKRRNPVVISKKLAEKLNVKMGSKVIITLQDLDNNITAGAFRIVGLFETLNDVFDEGVVYVINRDIQRLISFPGNAAHEIAILIDDDEFTESVQGNIKKIAGHHEVLNWKEISPEMSYLTESMAMFMYIFIIIVLLALLFGIINTMLMVVLERVKELGMLMAIGMNKLRIFRMIVLETIMLSLTGGLVGIVIGWLISKYYETNAFDLSMWSTGYRSLGYDPFVYLKIDPQYLVEITVMVIVTGIVASIYPAYKALKNDPADALRIE
ncbi:ABC transporter permease [Bacteroidota bacterium]